MLLIVLGCNPREAPVLKEMGKKVTEQNTREADRVLKEDVRFSDLVSVCNQVSIPDSSSVVSKSLAESGIAYSTNYHATDSLESIDAYFSRQLVAKGWEARGAETSWAGHYSRNFAREQYMINIQFGGMGREITYAIWCEDSSTIK
jgi:hypothetical protein